MLGHSDLPFLKKCTPRGKKKFVHKCCRAYQELATTTLKCGGEKKKEAKKKLQECLLPQPVALLSSGLSFIFQRIDLCLVCGASEAVNFAWKTRIYSSFEAVVAVLRAVWRNMLDQWGKTNVNYSKLSSDALHYKCCSGKQGLKSCTHKNHIIGLQKCLFSKKMTKCTNILKYEIITLQTPRHSKWNKM